MKNLINNKELILTKINCKKFLINFEIINEINNIEIDTKDIENNFDNILKLLENILKFTKDETDLKIYLLKTLIKNDLFFIGNFNKVIFGGFSFRISNYYPADIKIVFTNYYDERLNIELYTHEFNNYNKEEKDIFYLSLKILKYLNNKVETLKYNCNHINDKAYTIIENIKEKSKNDIQNKQNKFINELYDINNINIDDFLNNYVFKNNNKNELILYNERANTIERKIENLTRIMLDSAASDNERMVAMKLIDKLNKERI